MRDSIREMAALALGDNPSADELVSVSDVMNVLDSLDPDDALSAYRSADDALVGLFGRDMAPDAMRMYLASLLIVRAVETGARVAGANQPELGWSLGYCGYGNGREDEVDALVKLAESLDADTFLGKLHDYEINEPDWYMSFCFSVLQLAYDDDSTLVNAYRVFGKDASHELMRGIVRDAFMDDAIGDVPVQVAANDDGVKESHDRTGRAFEIMQYLAKTFSDAWEDDRRTLKPWAKPLITEAQIESGLDHRGIKRWMWLYHDSDNYSDEDEKSDKLGLRKSGERKFTHVHIYIDVPGKQKVSVIARWFGVPPNFVKVLNGRGAFIDGCEYGVHESPKAVAARKYHYPDSVVHASSGFDFRKEIDEQRENYTRFGRSAGGITAADRMRMHVLLDGWSMRQCRVDDPLTYSKVHASLPSLRLDYLLDAPPCGLRLNIYVDGGSGMGKGTICQAIGESLFPAVSNAVFPIGNDARVVFDGYDGEPVIVWNEMRASDFLTRFGITGTLTLLDTHPMKEAQHVKGSRVILTNAVNIINGIQPYDEFLEALCSGYTDGNGLVHASEDSTQIYRRMPMIICLHESDFDIYLNRGWLNKDLYSVRQYDAFRRVRGSMKQIVERLGGDAYTSMREVFTLPAVEAVHKLQEADANKVYDPSLIPDEFKSYGTVLGPDEIAEEDARRAEVRIEQEQKEAEHEAEKSEAELLTRSSQLEAARNSEAYLSAVREYEAFNDEYTQHKEFADMCDRWDSIGLAMTADMERARRENDAWLASHPRKFAPRPEDFIAGALDDIL